MNRRDRQGDYPEKSSHGTPRQKRYVHPPTIESPGEAGEGWQAVPSVQDQNMDQPLSLDQANFAYQLLLLQQRLVAYEQLHLEEIAELRQEIERLRRAFLQETSPEMRAISSAHHQE